MAVNQYIENYMKKVLIVSWPFPPNQAIGSQRPYGLAKYLPQNGWEPVILTVKRKLKLPDNMKVIETDQLDIFGEIKTRIRSISLISSSVQAESATVVKSNHLNWKRKLIKLLEEYIYFPDQQISWYKTAVKAASEYLDKEKVDAIISTSSPVTDHLIAKKLKQKYKIPWIADFRDPWSQNAYNGKFPIINYFDRKLELKTLCKADAIVTVTEPWINLFASLHNGKNIYCVSNGYDDDDFQGITPKLTDKFTITYAGSLYQSKRDPSLLFEIIYELIKENKVNKDFIEVRFYGHIEDWLIKEVRKYNLEMVVNFHGLLHRDEILIKLRESQVLLLLVWNNEKEEGFCPAKLYEYFGAKRPIIATGWPGSVAKKLIEITNTGTFSENKVCLRNIFLEYYQEFIKHGSVIFRGNAKINNYEYKSITKRYAEILNEYVSQ